MHACVSVSDVPLRRIMRWPSVGWVCLPIPISRSRIRVSGIPLTNRFAIRSSTNTTQDDTVLPWMYYSMQSMIAGALSDWDPAIRWKDVLFNSPSSEE